VLYRVFPCDPAAPAGKRGGALHVARQHQGTGRHDNPDYYGALYVSTSPESAVAERIQAFRGQQLAQRDLQRTDGARYALAYLDDSGLGNVIDLDEPEELSGRTLRPSEIATRSRATTQPIALGLFQEGLSGFGWWSTLEASWANMTLFVERVGRSLKLVEQPEPLELAHPVLRTAAEAMGVRLRP
jgi:hypothetical protein